MRPVFLLATLPPVRSAAYRAALKAEARPLLGALAGTLVVCVVIAVLLGRYVPETQGYAHALLNSLCIGLLAFVLINVTRVLLWPRRAPPLAGMLLLLIIGMPASLILGASFAAMLLGETADWLWQDHGGVRAAAVVATVIGTLTITVAAWVHKYTTAVRLQSELQQARAEAARRLADEAQLRLLRAQLEPHMLFNTLATLRTLIGLDPARAQTMLDDLVSLLRATLQASRHDTLELASEFALLEHYLRLMAVRLGPRLRFELHLAPELAQVQVPALLLQPLVENAIRHGIEPLPANGEILVHARRRNGLCEVSITDNGLGFDPVLANNPSSGGAGAGFGLEAVRARLRAAWGEHARLEIESPAPEHGDRGTRVVLAFPASHADAAHD